MKSYFKIGALLVAGFLLFFGAYHTAFADVVFEKVCPEVDFTDMEYRNYGLCSTTDMLDFGVINETDRVYSKILTIKNFSDNDAEFDLDVIDYADNKLSNENKVAVDWVTFANGGTHYIVPANSFIDVKVRVIVPANAASGAYYAKIAVNNSQNFDLGVKLNIISPEDELRLANKITYEHIAPVTLGDVFAAEVKVENLGNISNRVSYEIEAESLFGNSSFGDTLEEEIFAQDDKTLKYEVSMEGVRYGFYKLRTSIAYVNEDGEDAVDESVRNILILPVWVAITIIAAIVLIIITSVTLYVVKKDENSKEINEEDLI